MTVPSAAVVAAAAAATEAPLPLVAFEATASAKPPLVFMPLVGREPLVESAPLLLHLVRLLLLLLTETKAVVGGPVSMVQTTN